MTEKRDKTIIDLCKMFNREEADTSESVGRIDYL